MLKFDKFIFEADETPNLKDVAGQEINKNPEPPSILASAGFGGLEDKIKSIIAKKNGTSPTPTGNTTQDEKPTGTGTKLQENTNFTIDGAKGEKFDLTFTVSQKGQVQTQITYPLYTINFNNEEMNKQNRSYTFVDDNTYKNVTFIAGILTKWRLKVANNPTTSPTPPTAAPTTPPAATVTPPAQPTPVVKPEQQSNVSKYDTFMKIFEAITVQAFDGYLLNQFTIQKLFGTFESWKELAGALMSLKSTNPQLYSKSCSDFLNSVKFIKPESQKAKFTTKWYIQKLKKKDGQYRTKRIGDEINKGDILRFKKQLAKTAKEFVTTQFSVKNIQKK